MEAVEAVEAIPTVIKAIVIKAITIDIVRINTVTMDIVTMGAVKVIKQWQQKQSQ